MRFELTFSVLKGGVIPLTKVPYFDNFFLFYGFPASSYSRNSKHWGIVVSNLSNGLGTSREHYSYSSTASYLIYSRNSVLLVVLYPNLIDLGRQGRKKSGLFQHYPPYYLRTLLPNASWFTLAQDSGRGPSSVYLSLGGKFSLPRIAGDIRDYHSNGAALLLFSPPMCIPSDTWRPQLLIDHVSVAETDKI